MNNRLDRFNKRKELKKNSTIKGELYDINSLAQIERGVDHVLLTQIAEEQNQEFNPVYDISVSKNEVKDCLSLLDKQFSKQKYDVLFESTKDVLIDQLLSPLKLSRSDLSESDRDFKYQRGDYTKSAKTVGGKTDSFDTVRDRTKAATINESGNLQDANTGLWHDASKMDLDHNKPLEDFHNSGGFMLNDAKKREFGADSDNHDFTHQSINRSKGSQDHKEFVEKSSNSELDKRRTNAVHQRGDNAAAKYVPNSNIDKTLFIAKEGAKDGLKTGGNQGLQQAIGTLLSEFISATFSEVKDIFSNGWKNGQYDTSWLEVLKFRIGNIKDKLLSKWKNVAMAFGAGALAGFLSAISTALINMFVRTGKNVVRLIREGFMSLMKAIKTLLLPPEGTTLKQAAHEASKVLATGLVVTGGIIAAESIATMLNGIPFADTISAVLAGLISGLGSLFVVFMLDKLDMFGVNAEERHEFIMGTLDSKINDNVSKSEIIIRELGIVDY